MTKTSLDALYRTPSWITDTIVGALVALFTVAAAHSAVIGRPDHTEIEAKGLRGMVAVAEADTPAPALVFSDPVAGYDVVSPFGLRRLPWEEHARLHAGVDIAAPAGLPVRAVADGIVARAGYDGAYGRFVEVRHVGGLTSFYAHLGAVDAAAKPGTPLSRGEIVGRIGSTGSSTGSHLHLEVRGPDHRPLDPTAFLDRQFASLETLPLKAAAKVPRQVRVAHVSYIPVAKQALMAERQAAEGEAEETAVASVAVAALGAAKPPKGAAPLQAPVPVPAKAAQALAAPPVIAPSPAPRRPPGDVLDPDAPIATAASA